MNEPAQEIAAVTLENLPITTDESDPQVFEIDISKLIINHPEILLLVPPPNQVDHAILESSIWTDGVRKHLTVEYPSFRVLCGNTRATILKARGADKVRIILVEIQSTEHLRRIVQGDQLSQRNLSNLHRTLMALPFYLELQRLRPPGKKKSSAAAADKWPAGSKNRDIAAEEYGFSGKTFDRFLKKLRKVDPILIERVLLRQDPIEDLEAAIEEITRAPEDKDNTAPSAEEEAGEPAPTDDRQLLDHINTLRDLIQNLSDPTEKALDELALLALELHQILERTGRAVSAPTAGEDGGAHTDNDETERQGAAEGGPEDQEVDLDLSDLPDMTLDKDDAGDQLPGDSSIDSQQVAAETQPTGAIDHRQRASSTMGTQGHEENFAAAATGAASVAPADNEKSVVTQPHSAADQGAQRSPVESSMPSTPEDGPAPKTPESNAPVKRRGRQRPEPKEPETEKAARSPTTVDPDRPSRNGWDTPSSVSHLSDHRR